MGSNPKQLWMREIQTHYLQCMQRAKQKLPGQTAANNEIESVQYCAFRDQGEDHYPQK